MSISHNEQLFLNELEKQERCIFNTEEVRHYWGSPANTDNALSRLLHKHEIIRLTRGLYAVAGFSMDPQKPDPGVCYQIARHLVPDAVIAYQTAMKIHSPAFRNTIPVDSAVHIQTTHRRRITSIMGIRFVFISMNPVHIFDIFQQTVGNGQRVTMTGLEKTIIDGANHPDLIRGIPNLLQFIKTVQKEIDWQHFYQSALQMQNGAIMKRLGYLLERSQIPIPDFEAYLQEWHASITRGIIPLDSKNPDRGHIHTHWDIEDNVFECREETV